MEYHTLKFKSCLTLSLTFKLASKNRINKHCKDASHIKNYNNLYFSIQSFDEEPKDCQIVTYFQ
jgi:hypothetical protein